MANVKKFSVKTESLDEAACYIKDETKQYNNNITKLYSETQAMTTSAWKGVASQEFRTKLESYRKEFEELGKELDKFADTLKIQAKNYSTTETNITNAAKRL